VFPKSHTCAYNVNPKKSTKADAMTMRLMKLAVAVCVVVLFSIAAMAQGSATADLSGAIKDPKGAMVASATVTASNSSKGIERSTTTNASGQYQILNLAPGDYTISASAPGFGKATRKNVNLTVGQSANLNFDLTVSATESVDVNAQAEAVDTHSSTTARTIQSMEIQNLPTNGRNYVNFTLLDPSTKRDSAPSIGAAPTSGVNFSGQRARANLVNVDGMDAVDNSVNGIRSTVSQEAVQEFQVLTSNYNAEYGRAAGGVINIVSKSGQNDFHGNAFGFLRSNAVDATNPFSTVPDPSYTRAQYGFTLGGALKKDKTFYFFSFEGTRRQETGFTSIGQDNFGLVPFDLTPCGFPGVSAQLTQGQKDFVTSGLSPLTCAYAARVGITSNTALFGNLGPLGGNAPLFLSTLSPIPGSYINLSSLPGNYPISEKTDVYSIRLDHHLTNTQSLVLRASVTPSRVTGIQVNGQNQVFGQNSFSRTSRRNFRDVNGIIGHTWAINDRAINEFRFQYAHRGLEFNPSNIGDTAGDTDTVPDGQEIAINIPGFGFFGREPFSFVHRTEDRYQFVDNFSWTHHNHNLKFGVDANHLPLSADFTVNFGGLYNFGNVSASAIEPAPGAFTGFPALNPIQAYGLGVPQVFVQGIGNPHDSFSNNTLGLYLQDSWRIRPNFTLNYGLRYDVEFTPTFKPVNALSAAAQDKLGITQGIPRDTNNIAPRIGIAWDPRNDQKTVVRASFGIFYDHPLLALAFNSDITDGSQAPQLAFFGGAPTSGCSPTGSNLNAGSIFTGVFNSSCLGGDFGYLKNEQRFNAFQPDSVFINQNYLASNVPLAVQPFGFPVAKNFQYAYSEQANLGFEHELTKDFVVSFNYNMNLGRHLNRPINVNPVNTEALITNWERSLTDPTSGTTVTTNPLSVGSVAGFAPCGFSSTGQPWVNASLVSFFRTVGGINPSSFAPLVAACAPITSLLGISNNNVPFSDMIANFSNGNSNYHGLTTTIKKRFSRKYEFQLAHTWSHAIDDSTDLQSLLAPQDSRFPSQERSRSTFDQRNRIVLSGVYQSGEIGSKGSAKHAILSGWTVAPILEWSSGRPFNVLTGSDNNFDLSSNTDRPLEVPGAGVSNCGDAAVPSVTSPTGWIQPACFIDSNPTDGIASAPLRGNLPRNAGTRPHTIFNDLRVAKRFNIGERMKVDGMMDIFNAWNRLNVADVNVIWTDAGRPTASFDPRQIQFGVKLSW